MQNDYSQGRPAMTPQTYQTVEAFFEHYPLKHYKKGHILILSGEKTDYSYLLIDGKMKIYDVSYRGDEIIIDSFKPPALFPLSAVLNSTPANYIYEADSNITIRQAPVDATLQFLKVNPQVVMESLSYLYFRLDSVLKRMVLTTASNAKSRLVYALILECHEFGEARPDGSYSIATNEKDIAAKAGLSRETVSREAKTLKHLSLLEVHHNYLIIPSIAALEKYLESST